MMEDSRLMFKIAELTLKSLNGVLNDSDLRKLEQLLEENPVAVEYYQEILWTHVGLKSMEGISCLQENDSTLLDRDFWKAMVQEEKTAPEIEIPEEKPSKELIQKVVYPAREKQTISRFQIVTLVMSAAAMLFFVLFLRFAPVKSYSTEVATLVDQMNVKWADSKVNFVKGDRLWTNQEPVGLEMGIVKVHYDDGIDVLVEGPAKFAVERSGIYFDYGRLFCCVSESGLGFLVETPTARFVDLGTEFGVQADVNGSAELHVIKGKVQLFAGSQGNAKSSRIITENEAVRYNANSFQIDEIPITKQAFVRSINSKSNQIWHGETSLNLASIIAGHDGFKPVRSIMGIDPTNGKYTTSIIGKDRVTNNTYSLVTGTDFIDGVCVPDGELGPIQITSSGLTFGCPNTSGVFTHEIAAYMGSLENQHTTIPPMIKNGNTFEGESFVFLHSNVGITFDLQAIRDSLSQLELKSFKTKAGLGDIADVRNVPDLPDVDFWVLIDGQVRYERKGLKLEGGVISLDVEFSPQDQFLTLIVTDGLRPENDNRLFPFGRDGFYLIDPEITLTEGR